MVDYSDIRTCRSAGVGGLRGQLGREQKGCGLRAERSACHEHGCDLGRKGITKEAFWKAGLD